MCGIRAFIMFLSIARICLEWVAHKVIFSSVEAVKKKACGTSATGNWLQGAKTRWRKLNAPIQLEHFKIRDSLPDELGQ